MKTLKLLIFGTLLFLSSSLTSQVTSVDYQLKYDTAQCQYDAYIIINAGSATSVSERIQFNAQYSIIVPTGTVLTVTQSHMPLLNNATYTGTVPMTWSVNATVLAPAAQPESDFTVSFLILVEHLHTIMIWQLEIRLEYSVSQ